VTRRHHFAKSLSASWFATLATVLYGLLSVPLALRFLSQEEFGLFMLLVQLAGYLTLIEFGLAGSAARLLIDHKDRSDTDSYGSLILTGSLVFLIQASAILLFGLLASPWIVRAVGVPSELCSSAAYLLRWLCACFAFTTIFKMTGAVLYAHKRLDLLSYFAALNLLVGLSCMVVVLASGGGLAGLAIVFATQALITVTCHAIACRRLRLLPRKGGWGRPSLARFKEMFLFAKDVFAINISNQLLEASQLIIVTRTMGLAAAAMWSVGTKIFALIYQLLTKIEGTAIVFFSEMMVREERGRLKTRFRQVYQLSAGFAAVSLAVAVAINAPFVSLWAGPDLAWGLPLSAIIGAVVFLNIVTRCNVDLVLHTKTVLGLRYVYFLEALAFVGLAFLLAPVMGFYGIALSALCCLLLVRFGYTTWRIASYFQVRVQTVGWSWLKRSLLASVALSPFVLSCHWIIANFVSLPFQLTAAVVWTGVPAAAVLAFVALPPDSSAEIRAIISKRAAFIINAFRAGF
jgi:O-antigen/teichoic acid export membrane protein